MEWVKDGSGSVRSHTRGEIWFGVADRKGGMVSDRSFWAIICLGLVQDHLGVISCFFQDWLRALEFVRAALE